MSACAPTPANDLPLPELAPRPTCALAVCARNIDCAGGEVCEKDDEDDELGCCFQVECACSSDEVCDERRGICVPAALVCDPANPAEHCAPGELCVVVDGAPRCLGDLELPDACTVFPTRAVARAGDVVEWTLFATRGGRALPYPSLPLFADLGTLAGHAQTVECAGPAVCTGRVVAGVTEADELCAADVVVYPRAGPDEVVVVLVDEAGAPLAADAWFQRVDANAPEQIPVDADGRARVPHRLDALSWVGAYPEEREWITVVNPATAELLLVLPRSRPLDEASGVQGTVDFDDVHTQGDIDVAFGGLSLASVVDVDRARLFGAPVVRDWDLEGVTDGPAPFVLPAGAVLHFGNEGVQERFVALGAPGPRLAWTLGAKLRLADVGPLLNEWAGAVDEDRDLLRVLLDDPRVWDDVDHGHAFVDAERAPVPAAPDAWTLPHVELAATTLSGLSLPVEGDTPRLVVVGQRIPGRGFVPLGVRLVPAAGDAPDESVRFISYAPGHDGTEAFPLAALQLTLDDVDGPRGVIAPVLPSDDPSVREPTWVGRPTVTVSPPPTLLSVDADPTHGALRVAAGATNARWTIYAPAGASLELAALRPIADDSRDVVERVTALVADEALPTFQIEVDAAVVGWATRLVE